MGICVFFFFLGEHHKICKLGTCEISLGRTAEITRIFLEKYICTLKLLIVSAFKEVERYFKVCIIIKMLFRERNNILKTVLNYSKVHFLKR